MRRKGAVAVGIVAAVWLVACSGGGTYVCQPTQFGREYPYGSPAFSYTNVWFHSADPVLWAGLQAEEQESYARFPYRGQTEWNIMWWRSEQTPFIGTPLVEAKRLDAESDDVTAEIQGVSVDQWLTTLAIPSPGCWEVTGVVGDDKVTFVMELTE